MAEKLFGLTEQQIQRVGRVVSDAERTPPKRANQQSETSRPSPSFWVELTEEDPDNPGRYAWKLVDYVDHEWTDRDPEVASPEGEYSAIEANIGSGMVGDRVQVHFQGYDAAGKPRYLFGQTALPFLAVIVEEGLEGHQFPYNDPRYWARPVNIAQKTPPHPPEVPHDWLARATYNGEPFIVQNLAEVTLSLAVPDTNPVNVASVRGGPVRSLYPGRFVYVWAEIDDKGWVRYVCNEAPWQAYVVEVQGEILDGEFAGAKGWYSGRACYGSRARSQIDPPAGSTAAGSVVEPTQNMWSVSSTDMGKIVIFNMAESGTTNQHNKIDAARFMLGTPMGWTNETHPRKIFVVEYRSAPPVSPKTWPVLGVPPEAGATYTSATEDLINDLRDDLHEVITALRDSKLMR